MPSNEHQDQTSNIFVHASPRPATATPSPCSAIGTQWVRKFSRFLTSSTSCGLFSWVLQKRPICSEPVVIAVCHALVEIDRWKKLVRPKKALQVLSDPLHRMSNLNRDLYRSRNANVSTPKHSDQISIAIVGALTLATDICEPFDIRQYLELRNIHTHFRSIRCIELYNILMHLRGQFLQPLWAHKSPCPQADKEYSKHADQHWIVATARCFQILELSFKILFVSTMPRSLCTFCWRHVVKTSAQPTINATSAWQPKWLRIWNHSWSSLGCKTVHCRMRIKFSWMRLSGEAMEIKTKQLNNNHTKQRNDGTTPNTNRESNRAELLRSILGNQADNNSILNTSTRNDHEKPCNDQFKPV